MPISNGLPPPQPKKKALEHFVNGDLAALLRNSSTLHYSPKALNGMREYNCLFFGHNLNNDDRWSPSVWLHLRVPMLPRCTMKHVLDRGFEIQIACLFLFLFLFSKRTAVVGLVLFSVPLRRPSEFSTLMCHKSQMIVRRLKICQRLGIGSVNKQNKLG